MINDVSLSFNILKETLTEEAKPGKVFIIADVLIKNIGSDRVYVALDSFSLVDSRGYKYDPGIYFGDDGLEALKELYPGERTRGKIIFEIPESATGLKIQYDFGDFFTGVKLATWKIIFNTESAHSISKVKTNLQKLLKKYISLQRL